MECKDFRSTIKLAQLFENYVRSDDKFETVRTEVVTGLFLVCFRIKVSFNH